MAHKSIFVVPAIILGLIAVWAFLASAFPVSGLSGPLLHARDVVGGLFLLALYSLLAALLISWVAPAWPPLLKGASSAGVGIALLVAGVLLSGFRYGEYGGVGLESRSFLLAPASLLADVADVATSPIRRANLLSHLAGPDVALRRRAAAALKGQASGGFAWEQHPSEDVLLALAKGLRDPDDRVRESCALALEMHAPTHPAVLQSILDAQKDENPAVRERASRLAAKLGR